MSSENAELSLDEMLNDPIVKLTMESDRVRLEDVRECIDTTRQKLRDRNRARFQSGRRAGSSTSESSAPNQSHREIAPGTD
jgi:hypothetical protein